VTATAFIPPHPAATDLPVADALPALRDALAAGRNAVLVAPPGAGKTTLAPLALLDAAWRGDGRIVVLEPRRIAARAAATRMAALRGEPVGRTVGYRTRLDNAVSDATRIEVVTEGLLVRRLQSDPGLTGVAAVILDEIHERSLDSDLALALCLDLQRQFRPELRLLAMSATAEAERLAALMQAEVVRSEGRAHKVTVEHAGRDIASVRDLPEALARAARAALLAHEGDVLAFLPGMSEIRRAADALAGCGATVLALHGDLPAAEQDLALQPAAGRRVVLATSIAETSLTVPGVRIVVDGGWRRTPRLDAGSGLTRLATVRISRAAAEQRAGRAGREAPGVAVRLWSEALHRGLPQFDRPEIFDSDLSGLLLDCTGWGTAPEELPFPDTPPPGALAAAATLLTALGAIDDGGRLSETGRRMLALGAHPRLAAIMLAARDASERALAADIAALIEERDPLRGADSPADIGLRLEAIAGRDSAADRGALARIRTGAAQYRRRLGLAAGTRAAGEAAPLIAAGFPDRIAQGRGQPGSFRLAGGGSANLPPDDPLARAKLLAVATLDLRQSARIRLAAPLEPAALPASLAAQVGETVETSLDAASGAVFTRRRRRLGNLVLSDRTEAAAAGEVAALLAATASRNLDALPWNTPARQLQARVTRMAGIEPDAGWPDLSDAALARSVGIWLDPHLNGMTRLADLAALDMAALLRGMLGWDRASRLDRELPSELRLPGGRATIDYATPVPVAAARAQAFYGLRQTPTLAGGRVKLQLALLSPAGRPIAITSDLAGFWAGGWRDARRDMRGRYPKHDWPEDGGSP